MRTLRAVSFLAGLLALAASGLAESQDDDVVVLKNGTVITGTIIEQIPNASLTIRTSDGRRLTFTYDQIDKITRQRSGPKWTPTYSPGELTFEVGYGIADGYNLGIGVSAGATLTSGVYVGGLFVYHLGKSEKTTIGSYPNLYSAEVTVNSFYVGVELGYSARSSSGVTFRPYVSGGYFQAMGDVKTLLGSASPSEGRFYIAPGSLLQFQVGTILFGVDTRYVFITEDDGSDASAFGIFGVLGFAI